jgi:hypothetical protein
MPRPRDYTNVTKLYVETDLQLPSGATATLPAGAIGVSAIHETGIRYAEVSITAAQVKAIRATPISCVAAPGAGKIAEFLSAVLLLDYGSEVFTETADNLAFRYTDGSGAIVSQAIESTGFIDQSGDTMTTALAKIDAIAAKAGCENQALVLHNTGDGEIAGNASEDSVLRVKVTYRVHTTGW